MESQILSFFLARKIYHPQTLILFYFDFSFYLLYLKFKMDFNFIFNLIF